MEYPVPDPLRVEQLYNKSKPSDARVYKDGNEIIAEGKDEEIARGTDFSTVMQSAVDYAINKAYKDALGGVSRPAVVYLTSGVYTATSKIRIGSDPSDIEVPFILKGDELTTVKYETSPVLHSEPTISGAVTQHTYIKDIRFVSPNQKYQNDCIHLIRWTGYLNEVHVLDAREALRIEMGWGKGCGVVHSTFSGGPGSGTGYGTVHIATPTNDNTNNVTFFDCGFNAPGGGYSLLADDSGAHNNRLIDCHTGDSPGDGVKAVNGQFSRITGCDFAYAEISGSDFVNCRLVAPVSISSILTKYGNRLANCHVYKDVDEGRITVGGMQISNTKFEGETIIGGDSKVSNCRFTPYRDPQSFIVRFKGRGRDCKQYIHRRRLAGIWHF